MFPVLYQSYKHYSARTSPLDVNVFMTLVDGPGDIDRPFHYRLAVPIVVKLMRVLPVYNINIDYTEDAAVQKDFFHFMALNFGITILSSGLLFIYLLKKVPLGFAYLGSVLYLFSFYTVNVQLLPMSDAACHLVFVSCLLFLEINKPWYFAITCLIGIFTRENVMLVLIPWILLRAITDSGKLKYLVYVLPAIFAYAAANFIFPADSQFNYYKLGFILSHSLDVIRPSTYNPSEIFHIFLPQLPLGISFMGYAYLKMVGNAEGLNLSKELMLFPGLLALGSALGLDNNTGRFVFTAFPILIGFQVEVLHAWAIRLKIV